MISLQDKRIATAKIRSAIESQVSMYSEHIVNRRWFDHGSDFIFGLFVTNMRHCIYELDKLKREPISLMPDIAAGPGAIAEMPNDPCKWSYDARLKICFSGCGSRAFNIDVIRDTDSWKFCPDCGGEIEKPEALKS